MQMGAIRFQYVAAASVSSWLIERFGGSPGDEFSHVDYVMPDGSLLGARDDVIDGVPAGVRIRKQGYEKWRRREVLSLAVPADVAGAAMRFAVRQIGDPYDQDAIVGFAFNRVRHAENHWICSALATGIVQAVNYWTDLIVRPWQVAPNGHALAFSAIGARPL